MTNRRRYIRSDQHFLVDNRILNRIIDYADLKPTETVIEIGAGSGNLTELLIKNSKKVYAIEKDRSLFRILEDRCSSLPSDRYELIYGDALLLDYPKFDKVVSNIPYSISSEISFKLLKYDFLSGVLMYQLEFARRLLGRVGTKDYGRLTITFSYRTDTEFLEKVPKSAFYPVPEVDSALVRIIPKKHDLKLSYDAKERSDKLEEFFFKFLTAVFTQRRKKLRNAMKNSAHIVGKQYKSEIDAILPLLDDKFGDIIALRPYEISSDRLYELSTAIYDILTKE
ncbi:MAG TPA: ribosomal RNA small subunit methyltransferase A [Halobacteria archaeon]|jgi:16S rRNA (adenine1518-N6/adenine1519-N6)-dimethyltransferase|nr:ribosomal RNA small subunit methyltransferase A [Halobacteria archaeon]HIH78320.1 ribosomal RNA small subunit methyltransferase A [Halobacteria archaeon]